MKKMFMVLMTALTVILSPTAQAAELIQHDFGGPVVAYIEKYDAARNAESKFIIDGVCVSACTLITGLIEDTNVCATKRGRLGFHSAWFDRGMGPEHSSEGTRLLGAVYPEKVKEMLKLRGFDVDEGQPHPDLVWFKASELYKACN